MCIGVWQSFVADEMGIYAIATHQALSMQNIEINHRVEPKRVNQFIERKPN